MRRQPSERSALAMMTVKTVWATLQSWLNILYFKSLSLDQIFHSYIVSEEYWSIPAGDFSVLVRGIRQTTKFQDRGGQTGPSKLMKLYFQRTDLIALPNGRIVSDKARLEMNIKEVLL